MTITPNSNDLLHSLRLIRSEDPEDRLSAIAVLSAVRDDLRVAQVFEHLYQNDPDPDVREAAQRALSPAETPVVPPPAPAKPPAPAASKPAASRPRPQSAAIPPRQSSGRPLFLLNPANSAFVAKEMKRIEGQKKQGRTALWLAVIPMLVAGLMWAWILSKDNPDDHTIIVAVALTVAVAALLLLGRIQRQQGWLRRRMLRGEVTECTGRMDDDGDYKIKLAYRFRTPGDKVITGEIRQIRNDLYRRPLPGPGTPVAVYYRSTRSHKLL